MPRFIGTRCGVKVGVTGRPAAMRELLVELGHVAMMTDAIGMEAFRHLGEEVGLLGRAAGAGDARLGVDDDRFRLDRLGLEERQDRQLRRRRVAARIGDEAGRLHLPAIDLGEAVDRLGLQGLGLVLMAVPAGIGGLVGEPEIGREVDDPDLWPRREEPGDDALRRAMRQGAEDEVDVDPRPVRRDGNEIRQGEGRELREDLGHRRARPSVRGEQGSSTRGWRRSRRTSSAPV